MVNIFADCIVYLFWTAFACCVISVIVDAKDPSSWESDISSFCMSLATLCIAVSVIPLVGILMLWGR